MPSVHRSVLALAIAMALSPAARANEAPSSGAQTDAKAEQPGPPARKSGRGPVTVDPMQDLRERLAAKLGATKASDGKSEQAVRVSTQADGELQLSTQADASQQAAYGQAGGPKARRPRRQPLDVRRRVGSASVGPPQTRVQQVRDWHTAKSDRHS